MSKKHNRREKRAQLGGEERRAPVDGGRNGLTARLRGEQKRTGALLHGCLDRHEIVIAAGDDENTPLVVGAPVADDSGCSTLWKGSMLLPSEKPTQALHRQWAT
jgi:hypothetical protein